MMLDESQGFVKHGSIRRECGNTTRRSEEFKNSKAHMHPKLRVKTEGFQQLIRKGQDPMLQELIVSTSSPEDFSSRLEHVEKDSFELSRVKGILGNLFYGWARYSVLMEMLEWECVLTVEMDDTITPFGERNES